MIEMYCIKCGVKLPEEAVYCAGCGHRVYSVETENNKEKETGQAMAGTANDKEIVQAEKTTASKKSKYLEMLNRPIKLFDKSSPSKNYTEKGGVIDSNEEMRISEDGVLLEYLGNSETLTIPERIKNIGKYAFYGNKTLKRVVMKETVKHILQFAFAGCEELEEVVFSENTDSIGQKAFCGCKKLKNIQLPQSLRSFGAGAFANCDSIEQIVIPVGVQYIPDYCFYSCKNLWKVEIAHSVKAIGEYAFSQCHILKYVQLSEQIRVIESNAFSYCKKIEQLELPSAVYEIKSLAFFGCKALNKLSLSMKVDSIKKDSFCECDNLLKIHIYEFNDPDISLVEMRRGYKLILNIFKQISPERAKRYASEHNISKLL